MKRRQIELLDGFASSLAETCRRACRAFFSGGTHSFKEHELLRMEIYKQFTHRAIRVTLALIVFLTCALTASRADNVPQGSYLRSCRCARIQNGQLVAQCQTSHLLGSQWKDTSLPGVSGCVGDIFNVEGSLHCNRGIPVPDGSYRRTCRDMYIETIGPTQWFFASCKMSNSDEWLPWFVPDFRTCRGDIFNFEGFIACNKGQLPPGSYSQSCSDIFMSGAMLGGHCRTRAGDSRKTVLKDVQTCHAGSIENQDGNLTCAR